MLKLMVKHGPLCASQMATMLKRDFDGVSKHLRVMRTAGVVRATPGEDRRLLFFAIPAVVVEAPLAARA